jgi:hypothetical protein
MNGTFKPKKHERGYILLGVLLIIALSLLVAIGMLESSQSNAKTRSLVTTQTRYYYDVEETLNKVVGWLQVHSKDIAGAFTEANFNDNFTLGAPSLGSNEGEHFGVPTMVKMAGTTQSVMLSNNAFFGQAAFPQTQNLNTGANFDAVTQFQNADLGNANARLILIWARETDNNYEPVFRVDVVTGNNPDRGVHSYSYIYTTLETDMMAVGFYGRDGLTTQSPNNECSSFLYTYDGAAWSRGAPRANCPVASNGAINLKAKVHGTARTLIDPGIFLNPPAGDVSGTMCEGGGCHSYSLPTFNTWAGYCPAHNGDLNISANTTLGAGGCYRDISIDNKQTLTFTDYENPYYIRTLDFRANFAKFDLANIPQNEKVTLYIEKISNDHINGNQFYNPNFAPHQLEINYIGTDPIQVNGTASLNAFIVAPLVTVTVNGNFNYYGGIHAASLDVSGNARLYYDENMAGVPVLSDMKFALKKTSQRYR